MSRLKELIEQYLRRNRSLATLSYGLVLIALLSIIYFAVAGIVAQHQAINRSEEIYDRLARRASHAGTTLPREARSMPAGSALLQGATINIGGMLFQISYTGGTGNDIVLTRIA